MGNIVIYTNKLTNGGMSNAFNGTSVAKNVYVYNQGFNATANTWNSAINTTSGVNGKNGVTLINMGTWENACWEHVVNGTNTAVVNYKGSLTDVYVPKTINGKNVIIDHVRSSSTVNVFQGKTSIKRVKIENGVSFMNNRMNAAFSGCYNLVYVSGIPSTVTEAGYAFSMCNHLVNAPAIPANVTNMYGTFFNCANLINAPIIPANVTDMFGTFSDCTNITGNIKITSSRINNTSMQNCFRNTSKTKNVYIPFTGYNSVANTHNAAINSRYGINGKNGVTIYDINTYKG